ncbi:hypothetical protein SAMN05444416_10635 [Thermoactinomyces sp. DSM 45892]|nr:hypothetical protein SAMN05444416_10635 [Thermoactinomyces sp. DSM 45892]
MVVGVVGFITILLLYGFPIFEMLSSLGTDAVDSFELDENTVSLWAKMGGSFIMLFLFVFTSCFTVAGMIGSVNDVVFRNESSRWSGIRYGFQNLWGTMKVQLLLLLSFLVVLIPIGLVLMIPIVKELVSIFLFVLLIAIYSATFHVFIARHEYELGVMESIKWGMVTIRDAFGPTLLSSILARLASTGVLILYVLSLALIYKIDTWITPDGYPFIFMVMLLILTCVFIPIMILVEQFIITTRFRDKIAPRVFTHFSSK